MIADGSRVGTVMVPADIDAAALEALEHRVVPALETLLGAARRRDQLEAQLIETETLRRANVVKTTLLRSVSHDLRSPLTAIATAGGGLQSPTLSDEQRRELASVVIAESARLERLVRNLLDLLASRPAARSRAPTGARSRSWCRPRSTRSLLGWGRLTSSSTPISLCCAPMRRSWSGRWRTSSRTPRASPARTRSRFAVGSSARTCSCASRTAGRASAGRTWSGSLSPSTAPARITPAPGLGWRSRAASSR